MNLYERYVLPRLTDLVMRNPADAAARAKLIPRAAGIVVEVGIGSALNLPFYGSRVDKLYGVDPSRELWRIGRRRIDAARFPVEFVPSPAERIPLDTAMADSVVTTWTLCTVQQPRTAIEEIKRLLKPDGRFLFIEHGAAPEPSVRAWQNRLTPLWKRVAGGCHMNRQIDALIGEAGFQFEQIERGYTGRPKVLTYLYRGLAR
jgi:ubiquinone/menaquinone biosynthesis C-methylase UbiE